MLYDFISIMDRRGMDTLAVDGLHIGIKYSQGSALVLKGETQQM